MRSRSILLTVAAVLISAGTSTAQTPTSNHSDVSSTQPSVPSCGDKYRCPTVRHELPLQKQARTPPEKISAILRSFAMRRRRASPTCRSTASARRSSPRLRSGPRSTS